MKSVCYFNRSWNRSFASRGRGQADGDDVSNRPLSPHPMTSSAEQFRRYASRAALMGAVNPVALVALLLMLLLVGCSSGDPVIDRPAPLKQVSGSKVVSQQSYSVQREFIGALQAPQRTELSFDSAGPISQIYVAEGDVVEKGQVLASLDRELLESELRAAEASKRDLQAQASFTQRELDRMNKLRQQNFASESRIDQMETERNSIRARIDGVSANIASLNRRLEKTELRAPFAANVSSRYLDEGAIVNPGSAVFQLLETEQLIVRVGLPVALARTLEVGQRLATNLESSSLSAVVQSIGLSVSFDTNTVPLELSLESSSGAPQLYDGQIVRVIVPEQRSVAGTWIPIDSLIAGVRGSWDVYVLVKGGDLQNSNELDLAAEYRVERRKVNVAYIGGGRAYISHGLSDGDVLLDKGVHKVAAGQAVVLTPFSTLAKSSG